jgi:hypothetical protein
MCRRLGQGTVTRRWAGWPPWWSRCSPLGLDLMVLNVALPTLAGDLEASTIQLQWIVNAYTVPRPRLARAPRAAQRRALD